MASLPIMNSIPCNMSIDGMPCVTCNWHRALQRQQGPNSASKGTAGWRVKPWTFNSSRFLQIPHQASGFHPENVLSSRGEMPGRHCLAVRASESDESARFEKSDSTDENSASTPATSPSEDSNWTSTVKTRKELLLEYVNNVQPEFMDRFFKKADEQVVDAMRQTVSNMLGTLPPQFFDVTVSTVGENLAQLMFSVMMTGYMFRNAQYRIELAAMASPLPPGSPASPALPAAKEGDPNQVNGNAAAPQDLYAEGSQKTRVSGDVLRWNVEDEAVETMPAAEYIEILESEVKKLQRQLEDERALRRIGLEHQNQLLEYLKRLEPKNLETLTASAAEDALEAMNVFIKRLLGVHDLHEIKSIKSRTTVAEMARLLYWLMVVGYSIRSLEVRYDMEQALLGAPASGSPKSLPPTEFDL